MLSRYARQTRLPELGETGQERLQHGSVLVVGAGGLGLVDFDRVDETNLHRQLLYGTDDVGRPKLEAARERLAEINPHVAVDLHETLLSSENALEILHGYDVIVDGTDSF